MKEWPLFFMGPGGDEGKEAGNTKATKVHEDNEDAVYLFELPLINLIGDLLNLRLLRGPSLPSCSQLHLTPLTPNLPITTFSPPHQT